MTRMFRLAILLGICGLLPLAGAAQVSFIEGTVRDETGAPIEYVNVGIRELPIAGTSTDQQGHFFLRLVHQERVTLVMTYVGYKPIRQPVNLIEGDTLRLNITITRSAEALPTVEVKAQNDRQLVSTFELDPAKIEQIPLPSGNFESLLKTIGLGIGTQGGELSSQYSVRGGNFDENLVYVNDFEIYRPFLIRSGQQEGLSFINPDLVRNVQFSSGGFEARYGDKLSSVLDVQYKRPDSLMASVELSLLGAQAHVEGSTNDNRLLFLAGFRQKSNQYLLSSLNTKGNYRPSFSDFQANLIYRLSPNWELEGIANISRNRYNFIPESRVTSIGTIDNVKQIEVFFEGQEVDRFNTMMGGLSATYVGDSNRLRLKFITSGYRSDEVETFDIIGDYYLYQVESDLGADEFGERLFGLGYGTYQNFARNYLTATVANIGHKGYYYADRHLWEWGARYQYEQINDKLNEWQRTDSALYSLPYSTDEVLIKEVLKTEIALTSNRFQGYLQDTWVLQDDTNRTMNLTTGIRANYWDVNNEILISPRAQFSWEPAWERDIIFKVAGGYYAQPPFYRELRDKQGNLNLDLRAQKSLHAVIGSDMVFQMWGRDFRFISEIYYKHMWDLVPYEIEDVRIRYDAENSARGYAAGIDLRLNGEFVEGAESWVTLSLLQTKEDIDGDFYIDTSGVRQEIGYINRPTDQRVNVGILFQDYLPKNENFKVHLNLVFGTGLPFSAPESTRYRNAFRTPPYRRVDIGFSALLHDESSNLPPKSFFRNFRSLWASLEVFNLLAIQNTVSYIWIKDNENFYYPFPNFLTNRLLNFRLVAKF